MFVSVCFLSYPFVFANFVLGSWGLGLETLGLPLAADAVAAVAWEINVFHVGHAILINIVFLVVLFIIFLIAALIDVCILLNRDKKERKKEQRTKSLWRFIIAFFDGVAVFVFCYYPSLLRDRDLSQFVEKVRWDLNHPWSLAMKVVFSALFAITAFLCMKRNYPRRR